MVGVLNPGKCATCASGVLFNVTVSAKAGHSATEYVYLVATPVGGVTPSPTVKDCSNVDESVAYGAAVATVTIQ
jgi:hypothetical protein